MATINASDGGDAAEAMAEALRERKKKASRDAMMYWFEQSQLWLEEAATNRAEIDSEQRIGREENGLYAIQQSAVPPTWEGDHWEFSYPHEGAVFQEYGAIPHEIRARRAERLAFSWPDAPDRVKEQFQHTEDDLVFFESVDHPGIPAIGFVRKGRDRLQQELGLDAEEFSR